MTKELGSSIYFSSSVDGDGGKDASLPSQVSVLQRLTTASSFEPRAGIDREVQLKRLRGDGNLIGNETVIFQSGKPVLHRTKRLDPSWPDKGIAQEAKWIMDVGDGPLQVARYAREDGQTFIEFGLLNPLDENEYAAVRYEEKFDDTREGLLLPTYTMPSRGIGAESASALVLNWETSDSNDYLSMVGTQSDGSVVESVEFPKILRNSVFWGAQLDGAQIDATEDPSDPWKDWFTILGIRHQRQGIR
jgi:hypothetical protein